MFSSLSMSYVGKVVYFNIFLIFSYVSDLIVGRITAVVVTIAGTAPRTAVHRHQKRDGGQTVERTGRK